MTGSIRTLGAFRGYLAIPPPSPGDLLDSRCVPRLPPVARHPHGGRGAVGRHTLGVRDYLDSLRQFWRRLPRNALIGEWLQEAGHRQARAVFCTPRRGQHVVCSRHTLVRIGDSAPRSEEDLALIAEVIVVPPILSRDYP